MHFLSFAWKDRGIVIDVGLQFLSGFILEQFPLGIKQLERRCAKLKTEGTINAAADPSLCTSTISYCPLFIGATLPKTAVEYRRSHN
jgi:hypothetical protein